MLDTTVRATPVATGEVRDSWQQKPVTRRGARYESGVESHHYRARWVEHGVGAHTIKPKRAEALSTPEGPRGEVDHPGYGGFHVVAKAALDGEVRFKEIAEPAAKRWATATEEQAKRHRGIK